MKFLFLTLGYHPDMEGGACRYAAALAEGLAARAHEVEVITVNPAGDRLMEEWMGGVRVHRIPEQGEGGPGPLRVRSRNRWVRRFLERHPAGRFSDLNEEPTLLVSHHAYFAGVLRGRNPVCFFHGPWGLEHAHARAASGRGWIRRCLDRGETAWMMARERRQLASARSIWVASDYMKRSLQRWHRGAGRPADVVGGGVDLHRFRPPVDRELRRREWRMEATDFVWLTVRRLDPRMGLVPLIRLFAGFPARMGGRRPVLWMAGRGAQREELERVIAREGLKDRVRLLGFVPEADLPGLYGAADAVAMPSVDLEGFGLATVEALACGTPVVASDSGANPEVLSGLEPRWIGSLDGGRTAGGTGMGERMRSLMEDGVCEADRLRCRAFVEAHHGWEKVVRRVEGLAETALREGKGELAV